MRDHLFTLSLAAFATVALASGSAAAQDPYAEQQFPVSWQQQLLLRKAAGSEPQQ